jgi:hypothetical protein
MFELLKAVQIIFNPKHTQNTFSMWVIIGLDQCLLPAARSPYLHVHLKTENSLNSVAWVRERTIPTERPPLVSEDRAYGRNLGFLDRSRYFFQVAPQLYSRGWVDPVPDPQLRRNVFPVRYGKLIELSWVLNKIQDDG